MAKEDKTEKATPKKRRESREKGQVMKSKEFNNLMVFGAFFICVMFYQPYAANVFYEMMTSMFEMMKLGATPRSVVETLVSQALPMLGGLYALILLFILINYISQVGFLFSVKAVKPDVKRINPANYWQNIANVKKTTFELAKNLVLFAIIMSVIFWVFYSNVQNIRGVLLVGWYDSLMLFQDMFKEFALKLGVIFLIIGVIDYAFQKYSYEENLKMEKQEVKDEQKDQQGNPEVKNQQQNARTNILKKQTKKEVEDAEVVIVNPTHFAIVIRYKKKKQDAVPRVTAKGVDDLALAIKEIAKEKHIPIIENKWAARKMYYETKEDDYISEELYEVVGKILAKLVKEKKIKLD